MLKDEIEKEVVGKLTKVEKILKIILFGSYAYGNPGKNSDIDLLVVIDKKENQKILNNDLETIWR